MIQSDIRRRMGRRLTTFRRCILRVWSQIVVCSLDKPVKYRMLQHPMTLPPLSSSRAPNAIDTGFSAEEAGEECTSTETSHHDSSPHDGDCDLVALKISLLGDCQIGKTSFLAKYVGNNEREEEGMQKDCGLNLMDKTLMVKGARISFNLWEVDGNEEYRGQIPVACKDSVAILIMFDLTSRVTLNSVIRWYQEARKWNQTAIPIIVGTKFDDFIQLPIDLQWTIASQARAYAKALNATLFFSSATYNINVNKIFKFITAKLFDLPWSPERNLTVGEPIIDF